MTAAFSLPDVVPGEPIRVSASSYVTYVQCPESAMARFRGVYGPDSVPSFRGQLAHRLFARHLNDGPIADADLNQACREEIGSSTLNHKMVALGLRGTALDDVFAEAQALYARFTAFPADGFAGAEITIEHDASDDVELIGSIDARFDDADGARLVDWKTGELGDPMHQLRFYALLWALDRGALPAIVEAVSVKTGERQSETPSDGDVEQTAAQVARLVNDVRRAWETDGELDRFGGPACRYCPLLDDCDEGVAAISVLSRS